MSFHFWAIIRICLYQKMLKKGTAVKPMGAQPRALPVAVKLLAVVAGAACACNCAFNSSVRRPVSSSPGHIVRLCLKTKMENRTDCPWKNHTCPAIHLASLPSVQASNTNSTSLAGTYSSARGVTRLSLIVAHSQLRQYGRG